MTDALSQIAKDNKEIQKLITNGTILKCHICWNNVKNDKERYMNHLYEHHNMKEILEYYTKLYYDLWNDDNSELRKSVNMLYKISEKKK